MIFPLIVPPRVALAPWIHHIIVMGYRDASASPLPAVLSPNIIVFPRGSGYLESPDGKLIPLPRVCIKGPCLEPRKVLCSPNSYFVSLLFRVGCAAHALGPSVGEFRDQVISLDQLVPAWKVDAILERMDLTTTPGKWADLAQDLLCDILWHGHPSSPGMLSLHSLFKPVQEIANDLSVSVRQVERRMDHAYGANLRDVRRMVRFGYSFARLTTGSYGRGDLTSIAMDSGYYDQAHMNRDFKALAGKSPGAILNASTDSNPGLWLYRLDKRNFHNLFLIDDVVSVQENLLSRT